MNFKHVGSAALIAGGALLSSTASAEMLWSDFSLTYLNGDHYAVGDNNRQVLTVEHASGHSWGDNFFFLDDTHSSDGTTDDYFELSPRLSFGKITGKDLSFGPITDVLIATTWEHGVDHLDNYLYGLGFDVAVPGFKYFNVNLYHVQNDNTKDDEQMTVTWGLPFNIGSAEFLYDGFWDWSSSASDHASESNYTSQLKWNIGKYFNMQSPLYVGTEYSYWSNKFGIKDADERNASIILKWHF